MTSADGLKHQILSELTRPEMDEIRDTIEKLKTYYLENKWVHDRSYPVDSKYGFSIEHLNCKQRLWFATNGYKVYNYWDSYSGNNVITLCLYK